MRFLISLSLLSLLLQTGGAASAQAQTPTARRAASTLSYLVHITHTWDVARDGKVYRFPAHSLGTVVGMGRVLTHNHFATPPAEARREAYAFTTSRGAAQPPLTAMASQPLDGGTLVFTGPLALPVAPAPLASRATVADLWVGDQLTVNFWDEARDRPAHAVFTIVWVEGGVATLWDPEHRITPGDSGGGAFYEGALVGNTWSIYTWEGGAPLGLFRVALLPPSLAR